MTVNLNETESDVDGLPIKVVGVKYRGTVGYYICENEYWNGACSDDVCKEIGYK